MQIITREAEIKAAQNKFEEKLKSVSSQNIPANIKTPGGSTDGIEVFYSEDLNIWFHFNEAGYGAPRSWNPFGIGKPPQNFNIGTSKFPIICEINFAKNVKDGQGRFFRNESGEISVYHTGRFTGMGEKEFFFKEFAVTGIVKEIEGVDYALIGDLNSSDFAKKVGDFVFEVKRIRELAKSF